MKPVLHLITLIVLAGSPVLAQQTESYRVTERIEQDWDGEDWLNDRRISWVFTADGREDTVMYHAWADGSWQQDRRGLYTYDENGERAALFQNWDGAEWVNATRTQWTDDEAGNLIEQIGERWNDGVWEARSRRVWTYDAQGNQLTELSQTPDGDGWADAKRWNHAYDEAGKLLGTRTELSGESGWTNDELLTVTYDEAGNRVLDVWQSWDGADWVNNWNESYTFDENGFLTSYLYEEWVDGAWKPDYREAIETDDRGNVTQYLAETMGESGWENSVLATRTYGPGGSDFTESIRQDWSGTEWVNRDRVLQEIETVVSTSISDGPGSLELPAAIRLDQNYPNPFNPSTHVTFSILESSQVRITVFDVTGRQVAELLNGTVSAGEHAVEWSPDVGIGSGIYVYRIEARGGERVHTRSRSMILSK